MKRLPSLSVDDFSSYWHVPHVKALIEEGGHGDYNRTYVQNVLLECRLDHDGPVHVDDSYAKTTRFGKRLAPGIMVAGICTSVLTAELAGTLGVSIEDRFWFTGPVLYGDTIEFRVWIAQMNAETRSIIWQASATNEEGKEVLTVPFKT